MEKNLTDQDVLLVKEKDKDELKAVTGQNADGTPKTTLPKEENNPDFLKIDKHGNVLENFFANFMRQVKNPTHFVFFKVLTENVKQSTKNLQTASENPKVTDNKRYLDQLLNYQKTFTSE